MGRSARTYVLVLDYLGIALALAVAYVLLHDPPRLNALRQAEDLWPLLSGAWMAWTFLYFRMDLSGFRRGWYFPAIVAQLTLSVASLSVLLFASAFLFQHYYSRLFLLTFSATSLVGLILVRCAVYVTLRSRLSRARTRRVVILGNGTVARELSRKIARHPELMREVVGFLSPANGDAPQLAPASSSVKPDTLTVATVGVVGLLRQRMVDELLVALPDASASEMKKLVALCRDAGVCISMVPHWYELYVSRAHFLDLDGLPLLMLEERQANPLGLACKRALDMGFGSLFTLAILPFGLPVLAMLYMKKGSAFKWETRCGLKGKQFRMYRLNIERESPQTLQGIEKILARFSLTETPQLWNVVRGDMALVGPRPESSERVRRYSDWQRQRLTVRPGLTGLAQVHGLREQHSSEEKSRYDMQYIHQWSLFMDVSLLLQTVWTLVVRLFSPAHLAIVQPGWTPVPPPSQAAEVEYADRTHSCAD